MTMASLTDFLSDHADALNQEGVFVDEFTPSLWLGVWEEAAYVASLLHLAKLLKQFLRPVSPQAAFRADLRHQLLYGESLGQPEPMLPWWAAPVGFFLSMIGVLLFMWHWWEGDGEAVHD